MDRLVGVLAQDLDVSLGNGGPVLQQGHDIAGFGAGRVGLDDSGQLARHARVMFGRWRGHAGWAQCRELLVSQRWPWRR